MLLAVALLHAMALLGLVAAGGAHPAAAAPAPSDRPVTMAVRTLPVPPEPDAPPALQAQQAAAQARPAAHPPATRPQPAAEAPRDDAPAMPSAAAPTGADGSPEAAVPAAVTAAGPGAMPHALPDTGPQAEQPPPSPEPLRVAAAAPMAPAAAPPLPRYRASLPPPFEARFDMRRGALGGQASWRYSKDEGGRYRLELQTTVLGQNVSHLRSEGGSSRAGLEPVRFVDGRRGRDRRAVNFQRDAPGGARISFSGPGHELPMPEGVQDRLSWLLQLAAIVDAEPALRQSGARVSMWVVGPRGDADVWTFEILGPDTLRGPDGQPQPALALQRKADRQLDTEVRVWLDPAAHHLPLRAVWRHDGEGPAVELRRESLAWQ